jgi:DNA-binding NtrC family response regulator
MTSSASSTAFGAKDRILVVDDQPSVRFGLRSLLESEGYRVAEAETGAQALTLVAEVAPQMILLDLRLPDADGVELLPQIKSIDDSVPVLIMTAHGTIETAIRALKNGAENFLTKPFDPESLLILIAKTLEGSRALRDRRLIGRVEKQAAAEYFTGNSDQIIRLHGAIERLAPNETTVLLQGETGTGKGMVANLIHRLSGRREHPFVAINCAGLSRELLESELFGHERGAFTGAIASRSGLLELAHRGTVFFDEIAEMEPSIQAKLLNVIEAKRFRRVGGGQEKEVDVRIIAATNRNLSMEVKSGRFREDLFYRLSVMPLQLPPLRERRGDILPLATHFIEHFNQKLTRRVTGLTAKAETLLVGYHWPGNIRELRNVIERALILCAGDLIHAADLPFGEVADPINNDGQGDVSSDFLSLDELERLHIERVYAATNRNLSRTAEILGITRTTLYSKLKKTQAS